MNDSIKIGDPIQTGFADLNFRQLRPGQKPKENDLIMTGGGNYLRMATIEIIGRLGNLVLLRFKDGDGRTYSTTQKAKHFKFYRMEQTK